MSDFVASNFSGRRFEVGRVLQGTFGVVGRNPVSIFLLSVAVTVVAMAAGYGAGLGLARALGPSFSPVAVRVIAQAVRALIGLVTNGFLAAAVVLIAINDLNGRRTGLGAAARTALRMLVPVAVVTVIVYLGFLIGMFLLFVPGMMLLTRWFVVVPAQVAEGVGIGGALSRSAALTKGHRWRIFALVLVYGLVAAALVLGELAFSGGLTELTRRQAAPDPAFLLLQVIVASISSALYCSLVASCYVELRRTKEGALPNELAAVFD